MAFAFTMEQIKMPDLGDLFLSVAIHAVLFVLTAIGAYGIYTGDAFVQFAASALSAICVADLIKAN